MGRVRISFKWEGEIAEKALRSDVKSALKDAAEHVLQVANQKVPHDESALQRSGETGVTDLLVAFVSYDTPYARRLHENPQYNFQQGREGKWLERALKSEQGAIERILQSRIGKSF